MMMGENMITEKRFIPIFDGTDKRVVGAKDNGKIISFMDMFDLLNDLSDENEELKQRNNRQYEQLGRLYDLIEQKEWRALTDIIDDFKKSDEQLQKEWGTYGDVE